MQPKGPKQSTKTHRRSRTGCFTCRLRRKKCDEGKPSCRACKHLGLSCEYKRPSWWGSAEQRKRQKETIKMMIKRTKLTEKAVHLSPANSVDSPPELSRSLPTSDTHSDAIFGRHRSVSIDSGYTLYEEDTPEQLHHQLLQQNGISTIHYQHAHPQYQHLPQHYPGGVPSPYEYDSFAAQSKDASVNGYPAVPLPRRPSSTASFSRRNSRSSIDVPATTYNHHPTVVQPLGSDDATTPPCFDFQQYPDVQSPAPAYIPVEGGDRQLLEHFLQTVQHLLFPILNLHGTAGRDLIRPALANNECYRHCCLSISALHIKSTQHLTGVNAECVDQDITRHRYKTISGLCEALAKDSDHLQILEATLGMILFQCSVGSPDDSLPDIPWHQHFQAAISLINKLDLTRYLQPLSRNTPLAPTLNMALTAWIDILGATMLGQAPQFADTYRGKHLSFGLSGLRELMGCEDRVMYLISEIVCLEAINNQGMLEDMILCQHIQSLAEQIDLTEDPTPSVMQPPIVQSGHIDPRALTMHMTSAFRCAARIYLCSLVPGFDREAPQVVQLLDRLTSVLEAIPAGPHGFDRSLVWVLLIGGSVAGANSRFRSFFADRCHLLGEEAKFGSYGRMERVLSEIWRIQDQGGDAHWRSVMQANGWEFLLL